MNENIATQERPITASDNDNPAIEAQGLRKSFGKVVALGDVDVQVQRGELFGIIGPSGCGKTTLVRLLAGLAKPSSGSVRLLGVDPLARGSSERARVGYMPQGSFLFPNLTVMQNAHFVASLYGMGWLVRRKRIREMLERVELWDVRKRLASQLSGGMKRRLALACAVVHTAEVVFVDEPTVGLDPILRARIWDYLHSLRANGTTIVLTTQYVDEAAYCDTVALMRDGRIIVRSTPDELRRQAFKGEIVEIEGEPFTGRDIGALYSLEAVHEVEQTEKGVRVIVDDVATTTPTMTQLLMERGVEVRSVTPRLPTFDEVFKELVAHHD